jgi:hypothetical protein
MLRRSISKDNTHLNVRCGSSCNTAKPTVGSKASARRLAELAKRTVGDIQSRSNQMLSHSRHMNRNASITRRLVIANVALIINQDAPKLAKGQGPTLPGGRKSTLLSSTLLPKRPPTPVFVSSTRNNTSIAQEAS